MPQEVLQWIGGGPGAVLVDGTLGGGGHTRLLAERVGPTGQVIALDRDPAALAHAEATLRGLPIRLVQSSYSDLPEILEQLEIPAVDGILLDLGFSSDQLANADRGFSFSSVGPLDLRFDPTAGKPAWRLLERLSAENLANLIYQYGEERYSRRIAAKIVARRKDQPVRTAADLADLIRGCVPKSARHGDIHPATRTFQALRIAVNEELKWLEVALKRIPACLAPGGRIVAISYHSLEDRIVKHAFREDERLEVLTRRPVRPSAVEVARNPRARSAKLRVAERS